MAKTLIASKELETRLISLATLLEMYRNATCGTQRDHVKRASKTGYLHGKLWGMQVIFHATRNSEGALQLIDGYTRCECLLRGLSTVGDGKCIVLHIHEAETLDDVKALYDQCDNPASSKKAPDRLDEGLRIKEMLGSFTSPLMGVGSRAAAIRLASGGRPVRDAVEMMIDGMTYVDHLGMARTTETTSLLGLYIVIGQYAGQFEEAEEFIRIMNRTVFDPRKVNRYTVVVKQFHDLYREKRQNKSLTGQGNVNAVLQAGLGAFMAYLSMNNTPPLNAAFGAPTSLGNFIKAMAAMQ